MSNIYKTSSSGVVPPTVATSYVTDNGTAVPDLNILQVKAIDVTDNNTNGIQIEGGLVETGFSNLVQVQLTNRVTATATTTDATPTQLYSFALSASPGTYFFNQKVIAYNVTDLLSAAYNGERCLRTTGAAAIEIENTPVTLLESEEGGMSALLVSNSVAGNNAVLTVTGLLGKTINWYVLTDYIFIS